MADSNVQKENNNDLDENAEKHQYDAKNHIALDKSKKDKKPNENDEENDFDEIYDEDEIDDYPLL